jgi:hypothetical protein
MTSATKPSLCVRISRPRKASSPSGRAVLKLFAGGMAALVVVVAAMVGAAWLFAVALQARSDMRSVIAATAPARPEPRAPTGPMAGQAAVLASLSAPETSRSASAAALDPIGALPLLIPKSSDRMAATGSLGAKSATPAALEGAAAGVAAKPAQRALQELPLPLPRPRLAALGAGSESRDQNGRGGANGGL